MLFKNVIVYRVVNSLDLTTSKLLDHRFNEIRKDQFGTGGFVEVAGEGTGEVLEVNTALFLKYREDEKIIPPKSVARIVALRCSEMKKQGLTVSKTDRDEIKNQVIAEHLPTAMVKTSYTSAYYDKQDGYLVIDASGYNKAETLIGALREALGSLKVIPVVTMDHPGSVMRDALLGDDTRIPERFTVSDQCELTGGDSETITFKNIELYCDEVTRCINDRMMEVSKLRLIAESEGVSFTLTDDLKLTRLKYSDEFRELVDEYLPGEDEVDQGITVFTSNMYLMTGAIRKITRKVIDCMGGIDDLDDDY